MSPISGLGALRRSQPPREAGTAGEELGQGLAGKQVTLPRSRTQFMAGDAGLDGRTQVADGLAVMEGAFGARVGEGARAGADDVLSDRPTPVARPASPAGRVVVADAQEDVEQLGVELGAADQVISLTAASWVLPAR
jgi:hypothetical protein